MKIFGCFVLLVLLSCTSAAQATLGFDKSETTVTDNLNKDEIKVNIPITCSGNINQDVYFKVKSIKGGTRKSDSYTLKYTDSNFSSGINGSKRHMVELILKKNTGKALMESIVLEVSLDSTKVPLPTNLSLGKTLHSVFIKTNTKFSYVFTSIGTNFDYLNGGVQAKELCIRTSNPILSSKRSDETFVKKR